MLWFLFLVSAVVETVDIAFRDIEQAVASSVPPL